MNPQTIILIEPRNAQTLYPFSILHPAFELRCGALRLFEKVQHRFPASNLLFYAHQERKAESASFHTRFGTNASTDIPNSFAGKCIAYQTASCFIVGKD
jgi:Sugar nucleotidyl transferase